MLSFTGVEDCRRVAAEQSSNWEELQLLLSDVFRVSLCFLPLTKNTAFDDEQPRGYDRFA